MRHSAVPSILLAAVLGLTACSGDTAAPVASTVTVTASASQPPGQPATSAAPATSAVPGMSARPTTPPPAPPTTTQPAPSGGRSTSANFESGAHGYNIATTRVGAHDGFDRVVIELGGGTGAQAGWQAQYVPIAFAQGSGLAIDIPGGAVLEVILRGLVVPPPEPWLNDFQPNSTHGGVRAVYIDPVFEGQAVVYVGLDEERDFTVSLFEEPARIVIDIQRP